MASNARAGELRSLLTKGVLAPGCYDGLSAALIERQGFEAAYVTGGSIAYSRLGRPDIGLVSASEVSETIALIADRVDIPLIVDADTGFGNALNVIRTVKSFERAGATAIQLEDQRIPKRCGHLTGKALVSTGEMVGKLKAALDTRDDALIVARTDAIAVEGLEAALDRAEAYVEAGADILFVEAPPSRQAMADLCSRFDSRVPLLANMVEGGTTPVMSYDRLHDMGYRLVIFPGAFARTVVFAASEMLSVLKRDGTTEAYWDRMVDLRGINDAIGTSELMEKGGLYSPEMSGFDCLTGDEPE
ncbi:carboxyvinyl-carboxyphosphonate phosphorylmutase [Parasphingopyxis algicola]|nr:carboxyvinyl-carboxyphosphonate phosphorylmutase [Parasphingopyxis algicola]